MYRKCKLKVFYLFCILCPLQCAFSNENESRNKRSIPLQNVFAMAGRPARISCMSENSKPIQSCKFERFSNKPDAGNGTRYIININQTGVSVISPSPLNNPDMKYCNCSYAYTGNGLNSGDCSLNISRVSEFHYSHWICTLSGNNGEMWLGNINISKPLGNPYFEQNIISRGIFFNETHPQDTNVSCCVDVNSKIAVTVRLDNNFHENAPPKQYNMTYRNPNTVCRNAEYSFRPEDNGKFLTCHVDYVDEGQIHTLKQQLLMNITYLPVLTSSKQFTQEITANNSILISVLFTANPIVETFWKLEYDPATGGSFLIPSTHVKYKSKLINIQDDNYAATLEIVDYKPTDYKAVFSLIMKNEYGTKTLENIALTDTTTESPSDQYWITILIAIGIMTLLILISALIFILIKQKNTREYSLASTSPNGPDSIGLQKLDISS